MGGLSGCLNGDKRNEKNKIMNNSLMPINAQIQTDNINNNIFSDNNNINYEDNISEKKNKEIEKDIETKKKYLEELNKKIEEKEKELTNLKESETFISNKTQELNEREGQIIEKENSLNKEKEKLSEERQVLIENQKQFKLYEKGLKEKEAYLYGLESSLQVKIEQNKVKEDEIPNQKELKEKRSISFMNAILQALSNTEGFKKYFLEKYDPNNDTKKISNEIYKFLKKFWDPKIQSYDPKDFKNEISYALSFYSGNKDNLYKSLINFLFNRLHDENNEIKYDVKFFDKNTYLQENETIEGFRNYFYSKNRSIIIDLFYTVYKDVVKYKAHDKSFNYFNAYSFLEFPLKKVNNYMNQIDKRMEKVKKDGTNPDIDLNECFKYYNTWKNKEKMPCDSLDDKAEFIAQTSIYSLSPYLIILFDRGNDTIYKCNVKFQETLEIFDSESEKNTAMNLYAVICQLGKISISANFVAYCKHRKSKEWYCYNDYKVEKCTEDKPYNNGMVYLLFYEKVENKFD